MRSQTSFLKRRSSELLKSSRVTCPGARFRLWRSLPEERSAFTDAATIRTWACHTRDLPHHRQDITHREFEGAGCRRKGRTERRTKQGGPAQYRHRQHDERQRDQNSDPLNDAPREPMSTETKVSDCSAQRRRREHAVDADARIRRQPLGSENDLSALECCATKRRVTHQPTLELWRREPRTPYCWWRMRCQTNRLPRQSRPMSAGGSVSMPQ